MKYFILCSAIFMVSCTSTNEKNESHQDNNSVQENLETNNKFPYTEKDFQKFYAYDAETGLYEMNIIDSKWTNFELNLPIKENEFSIHPTVEDKFAVIDTLNFSSSLISKVIIYNTLGDNDSPILNVQLNSYLNGNLKDQLLLDSRFIFETEYFRTFEIQENQKITIHKFSVNYLEFNEAGDILGEKEVPDTLKVTVDYKLMNDGAFKKL